MARSKKKTEAKSRSQKVKRAAKGAKTAARRPAPTASKKAAKKAAPRKKVAPRKPAAKKPAAKKPAGKLSAKNSAVLDRASARAEVEGLINRLPPPVAPIVKTLRKLVLESAPEAVERVEGGEASYFAGGMFARIEPHERDVLIKFMKGSMLPSNAVLKPEGEAGTVTLTSLDAVRESVLRTLVREAVLLNLEKSPVQARA
ncbi:MAG: DUF1801 domain-containing protein [Myxococcota bacterium]|jgi:hypothetical protein